MIKGYLRKHKSVVYTVILAAMVTAVISGCASKEKTPEEIFQSYKESWEKKDYKAMYSYLSNEAKANISEKDFITRYTNIYDGIEVEKLSINEVDNGNSEKSKENIPFTVAMTTAAGDIKVDGYTAPMVEEKVNKKKTWTINWSEKMIFPQMEKTDKVRIVTTPGNRGEIYDRNGYGLAINGTVISIGVKPVDFDVNKAANITALAKALDIKESVITDKLNANSNPEYFVPIVDISQDKKDIIAEAMKIQGVIQKNTEGRIYQGGEAIGSLVGYIGSITAEELEKNPGKGYGSISKIGKRGLEQVYEDRLKSVDGKYLYISKQKDGVETEKIDIAKTEPKNGENITLAIDVELQKKIYESLNGEKGGSTAIDPKTGEVLAMVSSPSFDPNYFTTYAPEAVKAQWSKDSNAEFDNRFKTAYAPGSTFKLYTAITGLEKGKLNPTEALNIQGKQWQPDSSWGSYKITRVADPGKAVDLKTAFIYSDNIYFAQQGLKIGKDDFASEAVKFGIGETLPIDYPIAKSQISQDGTIKKDTQLADSSYGQGEVLMSPLHVALMYSSIVNNGNIMTPTLEKQGDKITAKVWKENVVSKDNIKILSEDLKAVVDDPKGSGHGAKLQGVELAGKTGTAELKKNAGDTTAEENGWFVVMNTDNPRLVLSTIVENVKNKGESHYVVDLSKKVLDFYFSGE